MLNQHLIAETRPLANEKNTVRWGKYRVTVLQNRLFRIERSENGKFRDEATQSVWFRDMPEQKFSFYPSATRAEISTDACRLILREEREECLIGIGGKLRKIGNVGNLKGTYRTLDRCDGDKIVFDADYGRACSEAIPLGIGVCSRTGVAVLDDSASLTLGADGEVKAERGDGSDEYVFAYGDDYRGAVKALYLITGAVPMIPRFALGNWWSRYHVYTDREYLRLLNAFEEHDVPLTVATIDMDWHYSTRMEEELHITELGRNTEFYGGNSGWTGYSWNKNLFPDYRAFLAKIKEKGLKITLNLHPADGVRWWEDCYEEMANAMGRDASTGERIPFDIADPKFINHYFSVLHKPYEKDGVAFWWIDWQQGKKSGMEGLDPLWALNHYHYLDNASDHGEPLILSRYAGVGSHRYPLGFSGDTVVSWKTLKYLPRFTATASNIGYTWWSHDIGGHMSGEKNDELYVRHIQYGVFSPVNRLHCSNAETMTKEPWTYGNGAGGIATEWLRFRHRLIPYLYTASYRTHSEGLALVEPLYYVWKNAEAYARKEEYLFGGELLVSPVTEKAERDGYARVKTWIPEGKWTDIFTGDEYEIPAGGKTVRLLRTLDSIPVLAKAGATIPLSADRGNSPKNPVSLEVWAYTGDNEYSLYEDGKAEGKPGEWFTRFKSLYTESDGTCTQSLTVFGEGDPSVIPAQRTLTVRFREIPDGEISLFIDGTRAEAETLLTDCAAIRFAFGAGKEYRIEVKFGRKTKTEKLVSRARRVLACAEGKNNAKCGAWEKIKFAKTEEEYVAAVEEAEIPAVAKARLKETL